MSFKKSLIDEGVVWCLSEHDYEGALTYQKRDHVSNIQTMVIIFGDGEFSICRTGIQKSKAEMMTVGYRNISEDEFNNVFIEAANWILYNTPSFKDYT